MSLLLRSDTRIVSGADPLLQFLPSGMTFASDNRFADPLNGTVYVNNWGASGHPNYTAVINGQTVPSFTRIEESSGGYGPWVVRLLNSEGTLGGNSGGGTGFGALLGRPAVGNNRRMYFAIRHRFSPGYLIHTNDEKFIYPTYKNSTSPNQTPYIGLRPQTNEGGPGFFTAIPYETGFLTRAKVSDFVLPTDGSWITSAFDMLLNTPNNNDGHLKVWVNGVQVVDIQNHRPVNGGTTQAYFNEMRVDSTRGGGNSLVPVPTGGQWREYDRVVLYWGEQ